MREIEAQYLQGSSTGRGKTSQMTCPRRCEHRNQRPETLTPSRNLILMLMLETMDHVTRMTHIHIASTIPFSSIPLFMQLVTLYSVYLFFIVIPLLTRLFRLIFQSSCL
jgi:hypothetical protein